MPFVCFPRAAVTIKRFALNFYPAAVADHDPLASRIVDDPVQRVIHLVAMLTSFYAGSGWFWHV